MKTWMQLVEDGCGTIRKFKDREVLASKGLSHHHVGLLTKGSVEIVQSNDEGYGVVVKILQAPAFIGVIEALCDVPSYLEAVVAFGEGELAVIDTEIFRRKLLTNLNAAHEAYLDLSIAFSVAAKFESFAMFDNEARLANLLMSYFEIEPENQEIFTTTSGMNHNLELHISRNQDDFAAGIGTSLRTISRIIKQWKSDRILEKVNGVWICYQPEVLKEIAGDLYGGLVHKFKPPSWFTYID